MNQFDFNAPSTSETYATGSSNANQQYMSSTGKEPLNLKLSD